MALTEDVLNTRKFAMQLEMDLYKSFTVNGQSWLPKSDQIGEIAKAIEKYLLEGAE